MDRQKIGLGIKLSMALLWSIIAVGDVVLLVIHGNSVWISYAVAGFLSLLAAQAWYQFILARRRRRSGPGPAQDNSR